MNALVGRLAARFPAIHNPAPVVAAPAAPAAPVVPVRLPELPFQQGDAGGAGGAGRRVVREPFEEIGVIQRARMDEDPFRMDDAEFGDPRPPVQAQDPRRPVRVQRAPQPQAQAEAPPQAQAEAPPQAQAEAPPQAEAQPQAQVHQFTDYSFNYKNTTHLPFVSCDGWSLGDIPIEDQTVELCLASIQKDGSAVRFVADPFRTPQLLRCAVRNGGLPFLRDNERTPELSHEGMSIDGLALRALSEPERTKDVCRAAISQNGLALAFVPSAILAANPDMYIIAVARTCAALRLVPSEFQTSTVVFVALEQNALIAFPHIRKMTDEYRKAAVNSNWRVLGLLAPRERTPEICKFALDQSSRALEWVPEQVQRANPAFVFAALNDDGLTLEFVVKCTEEFCDIAVAQTGLALKFVPPMLRTVKRCAAAIKNGGSIEDVPEPLRAEVGRL